MLMNTWTGGKFNLVDPDFRDVRLMDIVWGLARLNRFNGHTRRPWSVAQHSLLCDDLLPHDAHPALRLGVLLHDAHEAYTGDMISPVARSLDAYLPGAKQAFDRMKNSIQREIDYAIGAPYLTPKQRAEIHSIDMLAVITEAHHLMDMNDEAWGPWIHSLHLPEPSRTANLPDLAPDDVAQAFFVRLHDVMFQANAAPLTTFWIGS